MGLRTADISRDIFDEQKEYTYMISQQGPNRPVVDADFNDNDKSLFTRIRRVMQILGDGSPNNGFLIAESTVSNVNNFRVTGGDGTLDGAGRVSVLGLLCLLVSDVEWNTALTDGEYIHAPSTGLTATVLTDTSANYNVNELAGRLLIPNTVNGTSFTIVSNTATAITISSGDMTTVASVGDTYRVDPSTPTGARTDIVYLDVFLDEIDETEDPNLEHPLPGGSAFVSAIREKLRHIVKVRENSSTLPTSPYVDADGNTHYYLLLATLTRDANNTITASEIADNVARDLYNIASIRAEIIAARGSMSSLDARLDVSIEENGALKASTVGSSQIVDDSIVDADINSAADIDQNKLSNSDTYDDTFTASPTDLEDDLNRLRNEIKVTKGSTDWETDPTRDLNSVEAEQTAARGSKADLDSRLDVALNEDGTLKGSAVALKVARLAAEPTLIFYNKDGSTTQYRLHQIRGHFVREYGQANTVAGPYFNYDISNSNYALDVTIGASPGVGGADNATASSTVGQKWLNVYLIGKDDGSLGLVYSDAATIPPFGTGPLLDDSVHNFATDGWKYWKFIGAVRNRQAGTWDVVPMRKIGNHTSYEQAHLVQNGGFPVTRSQFSIATRVPPTSMRANLFLRVLIHDGATGIMEVSPASVASAGETMLMQDPTPTDPNAQVWKLQVDGGSTNPGGEIQVDSNTGWCGTDDAQRIDITAGWNSIGTAEWAVYVLGYEEFIDVEDNEMTF